MNGGDNKQQFMAGQEASGVYDSTSRVPQESTLNTPREINWSASEFIDHQKGSGWFFVLALVGVAIAVGVFFLTQDWIASSIILMLAIIFGIGAARRPRILEYKLDTSGITIDKKHTPYGEFRSFAVVNEGPIESVVLLPAKRWSPSLSIYFSPEDGDNIVDMLSAFVPFEQHEMSYMDRFLRRIRF